MGEGSSEPQEKVRVRDLAATFFRIGLTAYGGPAIVARIREVTVQKKGWLSESEFEESLAFCQTFPGPIAPQTAAHVGYRKAGLPGLFASHISYILPAVGLVFALSALYGHVGKVPALVAAFRGLGPVVVAIVAHAIFSTAPSYLKDWRGLTIAIASGAALAAGVSALPVLLGAAVLAVFLRADMGPSPAESASAGGTREFRRAAPLLFGFALLFVLAAWGLRSLDPALPALAWVFAKVDLLAFGGGYTAVALMFDETVRLREWVTAKEFVDGLAMSQITPGPVIVTATFIGYRAAGLAGAAVATASIFLPSALLLALLSPLYGKLRKFRVAAPFIRGLLAAFVAVLFSVLVRVATGSLSDLPALLIAAGAFALLMRRVQPTWVILGGLALSLVVYR